MHSTPKTNIVGVSLTIVSSVWIISAICSCSSWDIKKKKIERDEGIHPTITALPVYGLSTTKLHEMLDEIAGNISAIVRRRHEEEAEWSAKASSFARGV